MPRRRRISSISRMSSSGSGDLADLGLARALVPLPLLLLLPLEEAVACAGTAGRWVPGSVAAVSSAAPALRRRRRRRLSGLEITNRTAARAATPTPDQTLGDSTRCAAKLPIAVPIFQNISMEPVRYAASGSSDPAPPPKPEPSPRRRMANQLATRPRPVSPAQSGNQAIEL